MGFPFDAEKKGTAMGFVTGGLNALYATATQQQQIDMQKEWWYEMQKFLEEHNSPAYQSMLMRKAGLNPYQGVGSHALGNVSSELPGRPMELFNAGAISSLIQTLSQLDVNASHANQLDAQAGLFGAQTLSEGQRYNNLIQEWFYNEIMYEIGLIDAEERGIKRDELKKAYEDGNYTPTSDTARAADDKHNESVLSQELTKEQTDTEKAKQTNLGADTQFKSAQTTSTKDANERANELHEDSVKFLKNQLDLQTYEKAIQSFYADKIDAAYYARKLVGVDVDKVNPVFLPTIYQFVEAERRGLLTNEQYEAYVDDILTLLQEDQNAYLHNVDPDYIDKLERAGLYLDYQNYKIEKDKFRLADAIAAINADIGYRSLSLDSINTFGNILETLTGIYKKGMPSIIKRVK